jgi:2,3-bisphosphoglycerate-independent phosphoglycerate mutase
MTSYDQTLNGPSRVPPQSMARIVAETLAAHGRTSLRTAETEKYAHVTYFFNGGVEIPYAGKNAFWCQVRRSRRTISRRR